ncbi:MAG: hypothetical protein IPM70_07620 [Proteobacteria bacterium]|nr:hypothetical protein [Pseudomonadota bacterium]
MSDTGKRQWRYERSENSLAQSCSRRARRGSHPDCGAFGWVAIFSHVIQPGRPFEEYQAHAQVSGPWVSIIAGILIFYAASRWIAGSKRTAMALFGVFLLIDTALLIATWGSATHVPWLLYAVSYVSKGFACYLGGRYAEADMGPARVYPLVP